MNPLGRKLRERLLNGTWREKEDPMDNAGRDWSKWLPPAPLPDTGPKQMRATQVWASWPPGDNQFSPAIVRVAETTAHHAYLDVLAQIDEREDFCAVGTDGTWARHAVLVQDVGQAEPTPPEVLYGRAPCVGKWYSPASGTPFVLLRQKEPGTWVARDGGTDGLFVVMESFLSQCTPGPMTPSASDAIKATHVSIGKDGEMGVAFHREDPRPDEKTKPLLTDYARTETVMLAPGQWFDAGEGSTPFVLVGRPESGVWQARFHGHAKTFDVDESSLMQCRPLPPPPLQAPNPDEWEEDPNQPKFAAGLTGRLPAGEHVVLIAEEGHRGGAGLFAMRVPPGRWVDGKVSCSCEATDHGPSWFGWNTKNKLMRRRQAKPDTEVVMRGRQHGKVAALKAELDGLLAKEAPVGELLPGDVITLKGPTVWKLIEREVIAGGLSMLHRWKVESQSEGYTADRIEFGLHLVIARVPGWRTGQRRRIRLQSGGEHAGFFEGIVQPRIEEQPAGLWLLRRENSAAWGGENEWSELLAEAPSVPVDGDVHWHAPATNPSQWHGWRPGQKRRVKVAGRVVVGVLRHSGNADPDDWMVDTGPGSSTYVGASSIWSDLLEDVPAPTVGAQLEAAIAERDAANTAAGRAVDAALAELRLTSARTVTLPGMVVSEPVTFVVPPPPLREVSSNGREWVRYGTVGTDAWPFESFRRRRVDGVDVGYVEPPVLACKMPGDKECRNPGTLRHLKGDTAVLCDAHAIKIDGWDRSGTDSRIESIEALERMEEMDRRATAGPPTEPSCQPTLFGGIWRPW